MLVPDTERGGFIDVDEQAAAEALRRAARDAGEQFLTDEQAERLALAALPEARKQ
jgi:hypothetical protein